MNQHWKPTKRDLNDLARYARKSHNRRMATKINKKQSNHNAVAKIIASIAIAVVSFVAAAEFLSWWATL